MKFCASCGSNLSNIVKTVCSNCDAKIDAKATEINMQKHLIRNEHPAPGRFFLCVAGILYVARGILGIMVALTGFTMTAYLDLNMPTVSGISWYMYDIFLLLGSFFRVSIGIMGIINRKRLGKASFLGILGCIDIGFAAFTAVATVIFFAITVANAVGTFMLGATLAALYLIGASKNLKAYRNNQSQ